MEKTAKKADWITATEVIINVDEADEVKTEERGPGEPVSLAKASQWWNSEKQIRSGAESETKNLMKLPTEMLPPKMGHQKSLINPTLTPLRH